MKDKNKIFFDQCFLAINNTLGFDQFLIWFFEVHTNIRYPIAKMRHVEGQFSMEQFITSWVNYLCSILNEATKSDISRFLQSFIEKHSTKFYKDPLFVETLLNFYSNPEHKDLLDGVPLGFLTTHPTWDEMLSSDSGLDSSSSLVLDGTYSSSNGIVNTPAFVLQN